MVKKKISVLISQPEIGISYWAMINEEFLLVIPDVEGSDWSIKKWRDLIGLESSLWSPIRGEFSVVNPR